MSIINKINSTKNLNDINDHEFYVLGYFEDLGLSKTGKKINEQFNNVILNTKFKGKLYSSSLIYVSQNNFKILLIGLGNSKEFSIDKLRGCSGTAIKAIKQNELSNFIIELFGKDKLNENKYLLTKSIVEGLILGSYEFNYYKTYEKKEFKFKCSILDGNKSAIDDSLIISNATCYARDLANHPSNVLTPSKIANESKEIATSSKIKCTIFDREEFIKLGMGSFAAVARGTYEPPKFIILEYYGAEDKSERPYAFLGKGITFDTGGISIKPSPKMDEMKFDMCGAATVLGIMKAVKELKPNFNLVCAIAATENMPGGNAIKPGDIVKAYNGKTIEILNTDAEGRMVLADALSYINEIYKPKFMIDFATLTGAVIYSLGHIATGIMGNNKKLIQQILQAGEITSERCWELPLWEEYCEHVKSKIADVKNLGSPGQAGTIAGGAFLKEFVNDTPWVHLDIAGTAWQGKDLPYIPTGPSGVGVRLSLELLNIIKPQ